MSMKRRTFLGRVAAAAGGVAIGGTALALAYQPKYEWRIEDVQLTRRPALKMNLRIARWDGVATQRCSITFHGITDVPQIAANPDGTALLTWPSKVGGLRHVVFA